jgi:hypothetical protein
MTQYFICNARAYRNLPFVVPGRSGIVVNMLTDEVRLFPTAEQARKYADLSGWIDAKVKEHTK